MYILLSSFLHCSGMKHAYMYTQSFFFISNKYFIFFKYLINTNLLQFIPVLNFFITNWMLWCPDIRPSRLSLFKISLSRIALLLFRIALSLYRCLDVSQSRSFASLYRCFQFRPFVVSQFRCFVLSLFRAFVVSYSDVMVNTSVCHAGIHFSAGTLVRWLTLPFVTMGFTFQQTP